MGLPLATVRQNLAALAATGAGSEGQGYGLGGHSANAASAFSTTG